MTYVIDANVLIDYLDCAPVIITTVARTLGPIHVPRAVFDEACDEARFPARVAILRQLSLCIHDESTEQLVEAGAIASSQGRLSFPDALCLVVARDLGFGCITNDKQLRTRCSAVGVQVVWGLELILELVRQGGMTVDVALDTATLIHKSNRRHISADILNRFTMKLDEIAAAATPAACPHRDAESGE